MDQLPRLGKRELICLLSFTCNYVVFVWRGFLFLWVLGMGYVILLWHSLSLPYNYFGMNLLVNILIDLLLFDEVCAISPYTDAFNCIFLLKVSNQKHAILLSISVVHEI